MRQKGLTARVVGLVVAADIIQFIIMVSFKKLSNGLPALSWASIDLASLLHFGGAVVQSPYLWTAAVGMVASFIIWPAVLAALDLSVAFPLGSMSFVLIPVLSIVFLGEAIGPLRWLGIAVITSGIAWLSVSERADHRPADGPADGPQGPSEAGQA